MHIILSHTNLDYDGLASMIAAKKLYPQAEIVFPSKISPEVEHFLAIYKDTFPYKRPKEITWEHVSRIILVDTNVFSRIGEMKKHIQKDIKFIVYDHHPITPQTVPYIDGIISPIGATATLMIEQLKEKEIKISPFEATVFALGIYSDTGSFTYKQTTSRDLSAAAWCIENGANLTVVGQYRDIPLKSDAQNLFQQLQENNEIHTIDGVDIVIATYEQEGYTGHLSVISRKLLELSGADAVFSIVRMGEKVFITARASSERANVLSIIQQLGGGGHSKAASAMRKNNMKEIVEFVTDKLPEMVTPSITAAFIMSSPVRVVAPDTTIEIASKMLYRYGHTGFPVIENDKLVGIISRRDVDKALHHGLGHAPVKGYMSRHPIYIGPDESLDDIQERMIKEQIGRLPVIENDKLIGIVSRTDVISAMHGTYHRQGNFTRASVPLKRQLSDQMKKQLSGIAFELLYSIGKEADTLGMRAYLIGGMVRDLLMNRKNEDMDIVIEGDGILLAEHLLEKHGGQIRSHEEFRTATWKHPSGFKIDLTSARTEYYDFPAALPKVELSTIKEDLYRRDFTINAMGICLHQEEFGDLIDYFYGYEDLTHQRIKVLYNLSFVEDPTRILRGLRFENRFNFQMDEQTEALAKESANNLLSVSKQRISSELWRLLFEENPVLGMNRLESLGLMPFLLKKRVDSETAQKRYTRLHHSILSLTKQGIYPDRSIWISYLLSYIPIEEPDWSEVESYCLSKQEIKLLGDIHQIIHEKPLSKISPSQSLGDIHEQYSDIELGALLTYSSFCVSSDFDVIEYLHARERLVRKVNGGDLKKVGLKPGPHFRHLLLEAEKIQLNYPEYTKEDILAKIL
ncbi:MULTISPECIES: CBS domain-containing protein [Bacillaceae]|uniref:CBS domain-containing protein n=1 Tax=Evansella alkalicola TaxID=745819 RepID=A0ABS6JVE1_9BACI|nr:MULTISPECIES: CBS domain-containing protein [Bacillaceae]MBU9722548.1 CBS domain-containing protein [Bacillus alkalicola]